MSKTEEHLEVGKLYDCKAGCIDGQDQWFQAKLISHSPNLKKAKCHFLGFPSGFDTTVRRSSIVKLHTHTNDWRKEIKDKTVNKVDVFIAEINRFECLEVCEVTEISQVGTDKKDWVIRVGSNRMEPISVDSEMLAEKYTRSGRKKKCTFPGGLEKATAVAEELNKSKPSGKSHSMSAVAIYEELAYHGLLSGDKRPICISIFEGFERGTIVEKRDLQQRHYSESKALFFLEAAFAADPEKDDLSIHHGLKEGAASILSVPKSDLKYATCGGGGGFAKEDSEIEELELQLEKGKGVVDEKKEIFFDSNLSKLNPSSAFLRYTEFFHKSLETDWSNLPKPLTRLLDLADVLEAKAWRSKEMVIRRILFSESALIIEKAKQSALSIRPVFELCNFRLALHYVNGYGIDVSTPVVQESADMQASDYISNAPMNKFCQNLIGILLSMGRTSATISIRNCATDATAAMKMLDAASKSNVISAAFWKAKLILEGWGNQTAADRRKMLIEAKTLFEKCKAISFNEELAQEGITQAQNLTSATHFYGADPNFLLSLHGFRIELRKEVQKKFPRALLNSIRTYAASKTLPGPPANTSLKSEWLMELSEKTLFPFADYEVEAAGKGKQTGGSLNHATETRATIAMYQGFNKLYWDGDEGRPKWTLVHAKELLKSIRDEAKVARKIFEVLDEKEDPSTITADKLVASKLYDDKDAAKAHLNKLFTATHSRSKKIYNQMDPMDRFLKQQKQFYDNLDNVLGSETSYTAAANAYYSFEKSKLPEETPETIFKRMSTKNLNAIIEKLKLDRKKLLEKDDLVKFLSEYSKTTKTNPKDMIDSCEDEELKYNIDEIETASAHVVCLAQKLSRDSREVEFDIQKHRYSAVALLNYAAHHRCSIEAARHTLDGRTRELQIGRLAQEFPFSIGYHTIIDSMSVKSFLDKIIKEGEALNLMKSRSRFLMDPKNISVNSKWCDSEKDLISIFNAFQILVQAKIDSPVIKTPIANLAALSYADPWMHLSFIDLDKELSGHFIDVAKRGAETNLSEIDIMDSILTEKIRDMAKQLKVARTARSTDILASLYVTAGDLEINQSILSKPDNYPDKFLKVQLRKKMLFYFQSELKKIEAELNQEKGLNPEEKAKKTLGANATLILKWNNGLEGRCVDGCSSFFDEYILNTALEENKTLLKSIPSNYSKLLLSIRGLVHSMKVDFIHNHLSRKRSHYEGRTAGFCKLYNMLLLPLGLPGTFGRVTYPGFVGVGHNDRTQMNSDKIIRRYLDGGALSFDTSTKPGETLLEVVNIEGMTLKRLVNTLRSCIISEGSKRNEAAAAPDTDPNPTPPPGAEADTLDPRPKMSFRVLDTIIEKFCDSDPLIKPYYDQAKSQEFLHPNIFFQTELEDGDEGYDVAYSLWPHIARVLSDACLVRILEVTQYAIVPEYFWQDLTKDWKCL